MMSLPPATPVYCSWSGGKDCALALYEAIAGGADPQLLITMMTESGQRSRSHGLSRAVLEDQAAAIGVPVVFGAATWARYEMEFEGLVHNAVSSLGIRTGVFGDIDVDSHREWVHNVCRRAGSTAVLPLWKRDRLAHMTALIDCGFTVAIVATKAGSVPNAFLGQIVDQAMLRRFARLGIDLAGEEGEYHTLALDGPIFKRPVRIHHGERVLRDGVWFLDVQPATPNQSTAS